MFKSLFIGTRLTLTVCTVFMTGCAIAPGYTDTEQDIKQSLASSKFQPASREMRDNIETQELFAQAAFWSHEYELNPGDLESAIKLAAAVRKLGNPQRAVEIAQTSRALYPRDPYLTAEYAAALIASEQAYEAMQPLDRALHTAPGYARLWSLKGAALDQQENYDLARKHYARALEITPNDPNIMANIGLSFALSGDPQTAEGWLRRATSIPGASKSVRQNLSLILQLQGKEAEAAKYASQPQLRGTTTQPRPQTSYSGQAQVAQNVARPHSYQQSPRSNHSGIPASERSYKQSYQSETPRSNFTGQIPHTTLRESSSFSTNPAQRKSTPLTASDAARLAAQKSSGRRVTVPLGGEASGYSKAQNSVLDQISKTIGPQSNRALSRQSIQGNLQTVPSYGSTAQSSSYPQYSFSQNQQTQSTYSQGYPTGREAARTRRR